MHRKNSPTGLSLQFKFDRLRKWREFKKNNFHNFFDASAAEISSTKFFILSVTANGQINYSFIHFIRKFVASIVKF